MKIEIKKINRLLLIWIISSIFCLSAMPQTPTVTGMVTDIGGEPLRGVNVLLKGTTIATVTDHNGEYKIIIPEKRMSLVFIFQGYEKAEIPVNGRGLIDVVLKSDTDKKPVTSNQKRHEISIYGGGWILDLNSNPAEGNRNSGFKVHGGIGYHCFFTPHFGIGTGVEYSPYSASYSIKDFNTHNPATDIYGNAFEFRSIISNYEEKHNVNMLQIPLMFEFRPAFFYISAGGKVGIPLSASYKNSMSSISNSGYYSEDYAEYTIPQFMGFGKFDNKSYNGKLDFKTAFILSVEIGFKIKIISIGGYFDYGLNNIGNANKPFVAYNKDKPADFTVNSILNSKHNDRQFTDKVTPLSAGIKLKLSFGAG